MFLLCLATELSVLECLWHWIPSNFRAWAKVVKVRKDALMTSQPHTWDPYGKRFHFVGWLTGWGVLGVWLVGKPRAGFSHWEKQPREALRFLWQCPYASSLGLLPSLRMYQHKGWSFKKTLLAKCYDRWSVFGQLRQQADRFAFHRNSPASIFVLPRSKAMRQPLQCLWLDWKSAILYLYNIIYYIYLRSRYIAVGLPGLDFFWLLLFLPRIFQSVYCLPCCKDFRVLNYEPLRSVRLTEPFAPFSEIAQVVSFLSLEKHRSFYQWKD